VADLFTEDDEDAGEGVCLCCAPDVGIEGEVEL
jgi:hypothetical protein